MTGLAIVLSVLAAGCYAVAAWLQQAAVGVATGGAVLRLAGWRQVMRAPRWIGGVGLTTAGAGLHAIALFMAPLIVVQPVGVLAIAMTTVLATRSAGGRLTRSTVLAVGACVAGVGLFVALVAGSPTPASLAAGVEARACVLAGLIVAGLAALGPLAVRRGRCLAYSAAAGVAYGLVSVLMRVTAARVQAGGIGQLSVVALAGMAAALLVGAWFVQHAYAAGPPQVVVASQTVLDPMFGIGVGVALLGEGTHLTTAAAAGLTVSGLLAVAGVIGLAARHPAAGAASPLARHNANWPADVRPHGVVPATDRPLRIVIGADTFPPDINGASHFAQRLAHGLAGRGHQVHVICPATAAGPASEDSDGVVVHRVASRRTPFHPTFRVCLPWQASRAASTLLDQITPDVVHVQAHFLLGRALVDAATRRGIPVAATNHFMPENLFSHGHIPGWLHGTARRLAWWDLRRVYRRARVVTAPSPTAVQLLAEHGIPKATAVSCGVDLDHYRPPSSPTGGSPPQVRADQASGRSVLFVGRLDAEKRVDELLRAAALLAPDVDVRIEIIGDGSRRVSLHDLSQRLGIDGRVVFHGFVNDVALVNAYTRCDVFCMPGVAELQSLATMEAMAAGKPVVAADALALPHLVHRGRNGWLYPPGNVHALAGRLRDLLTDPETLARMGSASRAAIAAHTLTGTIDRFETIYRQILTDQPSIAAHTDTPRGEPEAGAIGSQSRFLTDRPETTTGRIRQGRTRRIAVPRHIDRRTDPRRPSAPTAPPQR